MQPSFQSKHIQESINSEKCAEFLKKANNLLMNTIIFIVGSLSLKQGEYILGCLILISSLVSLIINYLFKKNGLITQNNYINMRKKQISKSLKTQILFIIAAANFAAICISIFEFLIKIQDNQSQAINITLFLQIYLIAIQQKIQQLKLALIWILLIQTYVLVRLQIIFNFDTLNLVFNVFYYLFSISFFNNRINNSLQCQSVIQQQQTNEQQNFLLSLYKSILGIIPEGLAVINKDQKLLYANPTLKKILQSNKKTEVLQILLNLGNQKITQQQQVPNSLPINSKETTQNILNQNLVLEKETQIVKEEQSQFSQNINEQNTLQKQTSNQKKQNLPNYEINEKEEIMLQNKQNEQKIENYDFEGISSAHSKYNDYSILNQNIDFKISDSSRLYRESQRLLKESGHHMNDTNLASFNSQNKNLVNISQFAQSEDDSIKGRLRSVSHDKKQENTLHSFYSLKQTKKVKKQIRRENSYNRGKGKPQINYQSTLQSVNQVYSDQSDIISYQGFGIQVDRNNQASDFFKSETILIESMRNVKQDELQLSQNQNMLEKRQNSIRSLRKQDSQGISRNYYVQKKTNSFKNNKFRIQNSLKSKQNSPNHQQLQNNISIFNKNKSLQENLQFDKILEDEEEKKESNSNCLTQQQFEDEVQRNLKIKKNSQFMLSSSNSNNQQNKYYNDSLVCSPQFLEERTVRNSRNSSSFKLKVNIKQSKIQDKETQGQIVVKKTDVKSIIQNLLQLDSQTKKDQTSQQISEKEKKDSKVQNVDNSKVEQGYQKQTSFSKCVQKQNENNLNYFQQTDTKAKMQFLQVDAMVSDEKKDPLVLIIVQDLWQDLYQKKAQDTQKDKMRIFASLSHELRTPLNCSISMLEVIREDIENINPRLIEEYLNPALFSNKLLLNQINDLLDYVQMDSGKFKYSFYEFNILNLFTDCKRLINMQAKLKNIEIKISIGKQVPETISSDPNRIRQILLNFLSNSLKFTKKGYIEIGITMFDIQRGLLKVFVKDTGIGITKENLETIFDFCAKVNYNQKDQHLNRQGCGLGLTISNSIAKGLVKNNAENDCGIKVESEYGYGSVFSILIQDMSINSQFQKEDTTQQPQHNHSILDKQSEKQFQSDLFSQKQYSYSIKSNFNLQAQSEELGLSRQIKQKFPAQSECVYSLNEQSNSFMSDNSKQQMRNDISFNGSFIINNNNNRMEEIQEEPIQHRKSNQNIIDSSVIVEIDEDNKKDFKINSNLKIHSYSQRFEELEERNKQNEINKSSNSGPDIQSLRYIYVDNVEHQVGLNGHSKSKITLSNQNLKKFKSTKHSPMKIQSFEMRTFNFRSTGEINDKLDKIQSIKIEEELPEIKKHSSELNTHEKNSKAYFNNLNTKFKTQNTPLFENFDKPSKEQEGFTSYVGLSRFLDIQQSQKNISSQVLDQQQEEQIQSNKEVQSNQDTFQQINNINNILDSNLDPQEIVHLIKQFNQIQKKCGCPQIMVVDDNQFNTYALSKILGQYYFTFLCLSDGFSAIEEVESLYKKNCCKAPKIIFMDIDMPMKDGYQTAVEINQFYESISLPPLLQPIIIACTAYVGQEDVEASMQSGMRDFINKPILKNGFESLIVNWKSKFF